MLVGGVDICVRETVGEDYQQTMVRDTKIERTKDLEDPENRESITVFQLKHIMVHDGKT